MANCEKCGALMKQSQKGNWYCSAKCWLPKEEQNSSVQGSNQQTITSGKVDVVTEIVLQRTEKPHSYEFGPANSRHKIYYGEISELKEHIEALKLIDESLTSKLIDESLFPIEKI